MRISDWSSDVCSSDLMVVARGGGDKTILVVRITPFPVKTPNPDSRRQLFPARVTLSGKIDHAIKESSDIFLIIKTRSFFYPVRCGKIGVNHFFQNNITFFDRIGMYK